MAGGPGGPAAPDERVPGDPEGPDAARAMLAGELRASGRLTSTAVEDAFRTVPRHVFLPEMPASRAYQDEAFVVKTDDDGLPLSSSSQPAIMAIMLEQLQIVPGQRVLEIGTGTGYNAALMRHLVGSEGSVASVDIDPDLVASARENLVAAGYPDVIVICGDGGFGVPEHAPYDRIIVTAGASDVAPDWLAQLGPDGRIALPLSLRGIQLCVALERSGDHWRSRAACRCGFIRMVGSLAAEGSHAPLGPQPGLHVLVDDDAAAPDPDTLWAALNGPFADVPTGIEVAGIAELGEADLWATMMEPGLTRLTIVASGPLRGEALPLLPFGALAESASGSGAGAGPPRGAGSTGGAVAGLLPVAPPARGQHEFEVAVRGFGPRGAILAERLAGRVGAWHAAGRPRSSDVNVFAYPRAAPGETVPARPGQVVLDRPNTRLVLGWPAPP
jgi:protein-L-isoaspartate(D-aspartate) O-methyltransferase